MTESGASVSPAQGEPAPGATTPDSIWARFKRAWQGYCRDVRAERNASAAGWDAAVQALHAQCYQRRRHGRRDDRRQRWQAYLESDSKPETGGGSDG